MGGVISGPGESDKRIDLDATAEVFPAGDVFDTEKSQTEVAANFMQDLAKNASIKSKEFHYNPTPKNLPDEDNVVHWQPPRGEVGGHANNLTHVERKQSLGLGDVALEAIHKSQSFSYEPTPKTITEPGDTLHFEGGEPHVSGLARKMSGTGDYIHDAI